LSCVENLTRGTCRALAAVDARTHVGIHVLCMFIDKLRLNFAGDASLEVCQEDALKTAFRGIYSKVDGDRNGKVNFTEFSSWIIRAITGFDEFFKAFVSSQARSEKPPLYVQTLRICGGSGLQLLTSLAGFSKTKSWPYRPFPLPSMEPPVATTPCPTSN
jgi:hypothetical protein